MDGSVRHPKDNTARGTGLGREAMSSGSGALNLELPSKDPGGDVKSPWDIWDQNSEERQAL